MSAGGDAEGIALKMLEAFAETGPHIERLTSRVCPSCRSVCCIDRHGTHEWEDLAFLHALGEGPPGEPPSPDDTVPCRHLGPLGCGIERYRRPFRCTWYFCDALLEAMRDEPGGARAYRALVARLAGLTELRGRFLDALARPGAA